MEWWALRAGWSLQCKCALRPLQSAPSYAIRATTAVRLIWSASETVAIRNPSAFTIDLGGVAGAAEQGRPM